MLSIGGGSGASGTASFPGDGVFAGGGGFSFVNGAAGGGGILLAGNGGFGGTSFDAGSNPLSNSLALNDGDGVVVITYLGGLASPAPVPEPASLILLGTAGLLGLGLTVRRRRA